MGMWLIPALIAMIIICVISFVYTLKIAKMTSERKSEKDTPISETVEEYATILNPIVWVYAIFLLFLGIMIFYYWSKAGY
ncbi:MULTISPECIES: short-chain dehydrogenase [Lysinibacillus]|uniref:short-chain dehydrogenase n=1 Tax=Lysinibacillus TaxID=400634 RepID=UPI00214B91EC|nr:MULTISPECIES: short-chain dehydrogenase [Lysinibacillus]WHP39816.1 short-chain dehydrogenase [Lysinibacillus boronitolerans]UNT54840.1 short-chain dehydrogenase [Lysinibacillus capsici]UUV25263.1 short-chain dehydrogenase [Lysinibacillus sp. FN11]UYB48134.1 short-chain dehydrogenase [Lysinibacillus capsici]WDU80341.1 short-chain dehydrogenase [Lysinibacillus sp. G01H]